MPSIIDSLIVQLSLDATAFKRGQREVNDSWSKSKDAAVKNARQIEDSNAKLLEGFNKLKIEALGFFAALLGARGIKDFVASITQADAAVGRLAANIGEQPQMLQAWGAAVERVGGNASDASASLTKVAKAFYDLKYNGKALPDEVYRVFAMAGKPVPSSNESLDSFLNKTAGALAEIAKHDRSAAFFFGEGMGLSDSMVTLMLKYGDGISKAVEAQKGLGATDEQIKNASALQEKWSKLADTAVAIGRDIENWFSGPFMKTLDWVQGVFDKIHGATSLNGPQDLSPGQKGLRKALHLDRWDAEDGKNPDAPPSSAAGSSFGRVPDNVGAGGSSRYDAVPAGLSGATQSAMDTAMDQLRKEGVPEGSLRSAASLLTGNAIAESALNPRAVHDGGTGYGIYGARLDRRDRMFNWLAANGYSRDSAEGQMRYMAHEAMQNGVARSILSGANENNMFSNSAAFTKAFENPAIVGDRTSQVGMAYRSGGGRSGSDGPVVFGDSIAQGLKDYSHSQGAAVQGMGSSWITNQISNFGGNLKGRKIVLSTGASNSHDPDALIKQLDALNRKGVALKDITVLGVGDRGDFAGYNERLKAIADYAGVRFQPITAGADHVHPNNYGKLWNGISGLSGVPGPQSSLSTLHAVHPVTTSSTSNAMHVGAINVTAGHGADGHEIAGAIHDSLSRYQLSMSGQSGQV